MTSTPAAFSSIVNVNAPILEFNNSLLAAKKLASGAYISSKANEVSSFVSKLTSSTALNVVPEGLTTVISYKVPGAGFAVSPPA